MNKPLQNQHFLPGFHLLQKSETEEKFLISRKERFKI
jgi:hypothetical protein